MLDVGCGFENILWFLLRSVCMRKRTVVQHWRRGYDLKPFEEHELISSSK
ncbi:hypothetical protein Hanom_Chr13g01215841 [Helianthus anomalus]